MNSSDHENAAQPARYSGRVLMGCDTPGAGFVTIQEIEGKRHRPVWDEATEAEYIERCKAKAETLARDIVTQALARAHAEAQAIRDGARAEVDQAVASAEAQALAEAQARLDADFQAQSKTMRGLVRAIKGLGMEVWDARRRDFATLARRFAERVLAVEVDARRAEVLETLMNEACEKLESHREFTIKVAPQDFDTARAMLDEIVAARPDLGSFKLAVDQGLQMGGVVLETPEMLADNAVESRLDILKPYLDQLGLPEDIDEARAPATSQAPAQEAGENHGA
jgi:flagellar assembly protein FliH